VKSTDLEIIRVVVKLGMDNALLEELIQDLRGAVTACADRESSAGDSEEAGRRAHGKAVKLLKAYHGFSERREKIPA
jgi:hypothetical protein